MTIRQNSKRRYIKPGITAIEVTERMCSGSSNGSPPPIEELSDEDGPVFYHGGEGKDPSTAYGKGHNSVWDDDWDNE